MADPRRMTALLSGLTQLGVPYHSTRRHAGQGVRLLRPHQLGLVAERRGPAPPVRRADPQRQPGRARAAVQPGDLLYYPGHVMLALGIGGAIVHAPHTGNVVEVRMLSEHQQRRLRAGDPLG